jgi:hypothetical protein
VSPEERAARERKQKIFVAVGGIFMVLVLVFFTLPKVLSGGGSSPSSVATTETTPTPAGQVATSTTTGVSTPTSSRTPAALATSAKLTSFTLFKPKDPFVQQVKTEDGVESTGAPGAVAGKGPGGAKGKTPTTTFSTGDKVESATIVTVNGERQVLQPGMKFPSADPLFVLVAEKPGAKSVVVGIAGGAYSGGAKTTTLKVGKTLTLVNTTTGARYKITLVSVGSGDADKQPPAKQ